MSYKSAKKFWDKQRKHYPDMSDQEFIEMVDGVDHLIDEVYAIRKQHRKDMGKDHVCDKTCVNEKIN